MNLTRLEQLLFCQDKKRKRIWSSLEIVLLKKIKCSKEPSQKEPLCHRTQKGSTLVRLHAVH